MNCVEKLNISIEYGWILSRAQNFRKTKMYKDILKKAVQRYGFKTEKSIEANQDDCHFDMTDYYDGWNQLRPLSPKN